MGLWVLALAGCSPKTSNPSSKKNAPSLNAQTQPLDPQTARKVTQLFIDGATKAAQGKTKEALKLYRQVLDLAPSLAAAHFQLALLLLQENNVFEAQQHARRALALDPTNLFYHKLVIDNYERARQYPESISALRTACDQFPENTDLLGRLADMYLQLGKYDEALATYDRIENRVGINEQLVLERLRVLQASGKVDQVATELEKLRQANPSNPQYSELLAESYNALGRRQDAITVLEDLLRQMPDHPFGAFALAELYQQDGQTGRADSLMRKAFGNPTVALDAKIQYLINLLNRPDAPSTQAGSNLKAGEVLARQLVADYPKSAAAHALMGDLYRNRQSLDSARLAYKRSVAIDETNLAVWDQLLLITSDLQLFDSLARDSERALIVYPNNLLFNYLNGLANYQIKDYEAAASSLERFARIGSPDKSLLTQVLTLLGDTYYFLEDYAASDESYEEALKIAPDDQHTLNNYAYFLSLRGARLADARLMIEKVIRQAPDQPAYQDTYGWILYLQGDYEAARNWIEKAYNSGGSGEVTEHLGDVYYRLGQADRALELWREALQQGHDTPALRQKINSGKL